MSHHIGETNKMVSETPRMDASAYDDGAIWETGCDIERELNAASKERDDALMMLGMYRMKSDEQKQRIKRLEEAGDKAILNSYLPDRIAMWDKAKEDKL